MVGSYRLGLSGLQAIHRPPTGADGASCQTPVALSSCNFAAAPFCISRHSPHQRHGDDTRFTTVTPQCSVDALRRRPRLSRPLGTLRAQRPQSVLFDVTSKMEGRQQQEQGNFGREGYRFTAEADAVGEAKRL